MELGIKRQYLSALVACADQSPAPKGAPMEFRQLEAFVAVATQVHFGRAAEKLGIAQPTLSELVRRLEREMSTPLLPRATRRVALTRAGSELRARTQAIIDSAPAAARFVQLGLTVEVPPQWVAQPGHLRFAGVSTGRTEDQ